MPSKDTRCRRSFLGRGIDVLDERIAAPGAQSPAQAQAGNSRRMRRQATTQEAQAEAAAPDGRIHRPRRRAFLLQWSAQIPDA